MSSLRKPTKEKVNLGALGSAGASLLLGEQTKTSISAPWGPKNGRNGPIWAIDRKNRIGGCDSTEISVVLSLGIIRIDA